MLRTLQVANFQCHEEKTVHFNPHVNIITGTSDSGKSALIRAIEWVRTNRPLGDAFVREGADNCTVTLTLSNGRVSRSKTGAGNAYAVTTEDGNTPFTAFKTAVPDEVSALLRLSDVNVQRQFDPPFLLSMSPSEVGRFFNQCADLSETDRVMTTLNRDMSRKKAAHKHVLEEIDKHRAALLPQDALDNAVILADKVCVLEDKRAALMRVINTLANAIENVAATIKQLHALPSSLTVEELVGTHRAINGLQQKVAQKRDVYARLMRMVSDVEDKQTQLAACGKLRLPKTVEDRLNMLTAQQRDTTHYINRLSTVLDTAQELIDEIATHQETFDVFVDSCNIRDVACPVCNGRGRIHSIRDLIV